MTSGEIPSCSPRAMAWMAPRASSFPGQLDNHPRGAKSAWLTAGRSMREVSSPATCPGPTRFFSPVDLTQELHPRLRGHGLFD